MTKSTFMKLPEGEKAAYVLSSGRQITTKRQGENFANLFSVEDFLVEVLFDADKNQIISIDIIEDSDVIDSYIDAGLLK